MKRRTFCALLFLAVCVCLLSQAAFAAPGTGEAAEPESDTLITHVSIPGYYRFMNGESSMTTFRFDNVVFELAEQGVEIETWSAYCDDTDTYVDYSDKFETGREYSVKVELLPLPGYQFAADCTFDFAGRVEVDTKYCDVGSSEAVVWSVPETCAPRVTLDYVYLPGIGLPKEYDTAEEVYPYMLYKEEINAQGFDFELSDFKFCHTSNGNWLSPEDTFVSGESYFLSVFLHKLPGYDISPDCVFDLGDNYKIDFLGTDTGNVNISSEPFYPVQGTGVWVDGMEIDPASPSLYLDDGGEVRYNAEKQTLYVYGAALENEYVGNGFSAAIYSKHDLTIDLGSHTVSNNTILLTGETEVARYGIYVKGDLTVTGTRDLSVRVGSSPAGGAALYAAGNITLNANCNLSFGGVSAENCTDYGIFTFGSGTGAPLTVTGGRLNDTVYAQGTVCAINSWPLLDGYSSYASKSLDGELEPCDLGNTYPERRQVLLKKTKVEVIDISGFGAMIVGKTPEECMHFEEYSNFGDYGVRLASCTFFCDSEEVEILRDDPFIAGELYSVGLRFEALPGYTLSEDLVFDFLGEAEVDPEYSKVYTSDDGSDFATVWSVPQEPLIAINAVNVLLDIPEPGDPVADYNGMRAPEYADWQFTEYPIQWSRVDGEEIGEYFESGVSYTAWLRITEKKGYIVTEDTVITVNSSDALIVGTETIGTAKEHSLWIYASPILPQIAVPDPLPLDAKFYATCSFDERLAVNYYVPDSYLAGYSNVRLEVVFENWAGDVMTLTDPQDIAGSSANYNNMACQKFTFSGISAPQVGNRIYTVLCAEKDGVSYRSRQINYAIGDYCYNMLKDGSGADAGLKKLCVNVLNYSSAAQTYFNMNPGSLVNAQLTDAQKALAGGNVAVTARASKTQISGTKKLDGISAKVNMASAPELIFDLTLKSGVSPSSLRVFYSYESLTGKKTVSGYIPVTDDRGGNVYRVKLDGFASADMRQPVTVKVLEGDTPVYDIITYSLECYCTSMLDTAITDANRAEMTKLQPLCQQMMNYSNAAKEYFVK